MVGTRSTSHANTPTTGSAIRRLQQHTASHPHSKENSPVATPSSARKKVDTNSNRKILDTWDIKTRNSASTSPEAQRQTPTTTRSRSRTPAPAPVPAPASSTKKKRQREESPDENENVELDELALPPAKGRQSNETSNKKQKRAPLKDVNPKTPTKTKKAVKDDDAEVELDFDEPMAMQVVPESPIPQLSVTKSELDRTCTHLLSKLAGSTLIPLVGLDTQVSKVSSLVEATVERGESNSCLIVGPRGSGKTALLRTVLSKAKEKYSAELSSSSSTPFFEVWLSGFFQTDDKIAVREISRQLRVELQLEETRSLTIAECLSQLLNSLQNGSKKQIPVVFILEEFDLFADHNKQSLLYNLFDISQSAANPILVLGSTTKFDAINLLEKRVKSRFSHRSLYTYPIATFDQLTTILKSALMLPEETTFAKGFNKTVNALLNDASVIELVNAAFSVFQDIKKFFKIMTRALLCLTPESPTLTPELFRTASRYELGERFAQAYLGLSPLEQCLLVAIKHCLDLHVDSFNFEMVYDVYKEFSRAHDLGNITFKKDVLLKAFENLITMEVIRCLEGAGSKCPREYRMYRLMLSIRQIHDIIASCQDCPEIVRKWLNK